MNVIGTGMLSLKKNRIILIGGSNIKGYVCNFK